MKMVDIIRKTRNYQVVNSSIPNLLECKICGRNTRTHWEPITKKYKKYGCLWACSYHKEYLIINKILSRPLNPIIKIGENALNSI